MGKPGPNNIRYQRLYKIWCGMKARCYNANNNSYRRYGGRGITVADEWLHDYPAFKKWAFSHGYKDNLTIERIDNNKGYCPDNCTWIELGEQTLNRSMNLYFTYKGKTQCLKKWCRDLGLSCHYGTIKRRVLECNMSFEKAISTPIKESNIDISGKRFGMLTSIYYAYKIGKHHYWLCKCDCGNEKCVRKDHLTSGLTVSCGCKKKKEGVI